ncbi:unnamed protein product [Fusarium graminearum]|uniref:Uncharacterized protein n=1 Tax=Gibberella zeae TaxID=5518 RepID=A0A9N8RKY7_GIBZA|nr:unnamed protein product [Fusarium graminearum]CAG1973975.1 unnamed protein product [Fusarium graminearum]CAG1999020.1 unnamed protein product [Fusarium graminearum]
MDAYMDNLRGTIRSSKLELESIVDLNGFLTLILASDNHKQRTGCSTCHPERLEPTTFASKSTLSCRKYLLLYRDHVPVSCLRLSHSPRRECS